MNVSDIRSAPYHELRAETRNMIDELTGPEAFKVIDPLKRANEEIDQLVKDLVAVAPRLGELRRGQQGDAADLAASQRVSSATADEGAILVRAWWFAIEDEAYETSPGPKARLHGVLYRHELPNFEAPVDQVIDRLDGLAAWCAQNPGMKIPGLTDEEREAPGPMLAKLLAETGEVESHETRLEHATAQTRASRDELVALCVRYFRMHARMRKKCTDRGQPFPPGGNFQKLSHWAATRSSERAPALPGLEPSAPHDLLDGSTPLPPLFPST